MTPANKLDNFKIYLPPTRTEEPDVKKEQRFVSRNTKIGD